MSDYSFSFYKKAIPLILLIIILTFRLSTLEILDLIDTTESRYSAVATDMFKNQDYITPLIPKGMDHIPYLGKPPLHFWLMVSSYKLFGIDEWTSRLPSFISMLVIIFSFFLLSKNNKNFAFRASFILSSSLLIFALSGTVILDVTLTTFVSLSIISAFLYLQNNTYKHLYFFWLFLAFGVLVKGPAAIVFSALPLLGYTIHQKQFKSLFKLISLTGITLFFAITVPWFYLSEKTNPGFLKYFFLNENILRYTTVDYGDLYGQGHVEPFGTAIWMFLLAIFPWTSLLISYLILKARKKIYFSEIAVLSFYWMFVPIFFLIFIRQLHFGYIVPALPGAAIWIAEIFPQIPQQKIHFCIIKLLLLIAILLCSLIAICLGAYKITFLYSLIGLAFCFCLFKLKLGSIETLATTSSTLYLLIYIIWSPIVGAYRSTETIIDCIANASRESTPELSIIGSRSFSAHWLKETGLPEISKPFNLVFNNDFNGLNLETDYILQSKKDPMLHHDIFNNVAELASWRLYTKKNEPEINCNMNPWLGTNCCRYNWKQNNYIKYLINEIKYFVTS